jgi:CO/xanthine dehydrogenase Mo-binding subunit
MDGAAPAIFNAVADATGAQPTRLPLTPERLMAAMETIGA